MFDAGAIVFNIRTAGGEVFQAEISRADAAAKNLGESTKEAGKQAEEMGNKQETAKERTRRLAKEQAEAARQARELAQAQERVGKVLITAGAAIIATTALTVKSAIEWESAWAGVTKTVDGTEEELAGVSQGLRDLTGVLPASHTEIAAVAEAAGQLGVQTGNVVAFTRTMIDLGETTNLSANDAATALARFMNVMGTSQGEVSNLGSAVVELGNNYATTEAEIVHMATQLSGAARIVGLSEGQTLGLAAALSSVGLEAQAGGSAVSRVMIDIAASVDAGGDRVERFARVAGVSAQEFTRQWKTDPGAALAMFVKGLADAEAQGKTTLGMLADLGISEIRTRDALLRSAAASDQFTTAMKQGNDAYEENNALQAEAAKRYETVESKLGIMRNRINDAAINLGSVFLPTVAKVAEGIAGFADGVASLPDPVQSFLAVGALLVGVIFLIGGATVFAIPKIVQFRAALEVLGTQSTRTSRALTGMARFLTGPWTIAIGAAVMGANLLTDYINSLKASTEEYQNVIRNAEGADQLFEVTDQGKLFSRLGEITASTEKFREVLDDVANARFLNDTPGMIAPSVQLRESLRELGAELAITASTDMPAAQRAFRLLAEEQGLNREEQIQLLNAMPAYRNALIDQANALGINVTSTDEAANETKLLELAQGDGAKQSKSAARAYIEAAKGAEELRKDLEDLLDVLNEQNRVGQDAITANIDYKNTLADVDEQIKNAREGQKGYKLTLDLNTQAGRDNQEMLVDLAKDAWTAAEAQYALDGNTSQFKKRLEDSRSALLDRIKEFGLTGDAAERLADTIMNIPSETEWEIIADIKNAENLMQGFVRRWDGKRINVTVDAYGGRVYSAPGTDLKFNADGAVYHFAGGGMRENHQAQIARAGDIRVWAEPETGGEAYIPLAPSKRARSVAIWEETGRQLGVTTGGGNGTFEGKLYLSSGEFLGMVTGVVQEKLDDQNSRVYAARVGK